MLANGATLGYRKHTDGENSAAYTDLPGLKEIPEVGVNWIRRKTPALQIRTRCTRKALETFRI